MKIKGRQETAAAITALAGRLSDKKVAEQVGSLTNKLASNPKPGWWDSERDANGSFPLGADALLRSSGSSAPCRRTVTVS